MKNAPKTANSTNDFDGYIYSGTSTSKQALVAIDNELLRVNTDFDAHTAKQKKRSWVDVVREKLFTNMQHTFKGTRCWNGVGPTRRPSVFDPQVFACSSTRCPWVGSQR